MIDVIHCPSCNRQLRLEEHLRGRLVKCPGCAATFTAGGDGAGAMPGEEPANGAAPRPPDLEAREISSESAADAPQGRTNGARRRSGRRTDRDYCPSCDGPVPAGTVACPHCGEFLDEEEDEKEGRPWEREGSIRRDCEPHRGTLVMVLGIIAVAVSPLAVCCGLFSIPFVITSLSLGITSWVMGQGDLRKIKQRAMDPRGRGQTQAGMVCGIIATCLACLSVVGWAAFYLIMVLGLR